MPTRQHKAELTEKLPPPVMSVQQVIDVLQRIEDKNLPFHLALGYSPFPGAHHRWPEFDSRLACHEIVEIVDTWQDNKLVRIAALTKGYYY